ncbi:aldo/keto reductase [Xylocopilactobacillus apicola]|uniref:2,5-diketo-D-gluconic acid reductase n=1 Tax=Xylocopilactobacillus apicola TaxID=2932184 RepID=A0AAU9D7B5_9LACO|nr:aldo/keto reductase [Xylocopilactobacillus apicola]BDR58205.1 2,5-diketo-D-gluconic acid reductase [Xylocopilactobacillus apicola]
MTILTENFTLNNGIKIPKVGFGTWEIPNGAPAYNSTKWALKAGYRHIDTALVYENEKSIGEAIKDSGIARSEIFLTTKQPAQNKSYDQALKDFDQSIKNLGVDYVDLYLIHAPWPWDLAGQRFNQENLAVWQALSEIYQSGCAKAIGVSNFDVEDLQNLLENSSVRPAVNQIMYYIGFTEPKISKFCQENDILVEAYSPLATGLMLNNPTVKEIAAKYQVTSAQLALRFVLEKGALPLPRSTQEKHIIDNAKLDFELTSTDLELLSELKDTAPKHYHNETQG